MIARNLMTKAKTWGNGLCGRRSAERRRMLRKNGAKKLRALLRKLIKSDEW